MVAFGGSAIAALAQPPLLRCMANGRMEKREQAGSAQIDRIEKGRTGTDVVVQSRRGFGSSGTKLEWLCARGCGACCKLDKGLAFPSPEEIFADNASHLELYKSLIGPDGWCIHYDRNTRTCSIYADRPFFCRVSPEVFQTLFSIDERRFHKEACRSCRDTISAVYGSNSEELKNFNRALRQSR